MESADFAAIEELLEELYPDGMEEVEVNDFFWFDGDTIAQALGYEDEEDMLERKEFAKMTINGVFIQARNPPPDELALTQRTIIYYNLATAQAKRAFRKR